MTQTQESPAVNERNVHPLEDEAEFLAKEQSDKRVENDLANPGSLDKKDKDFAAMNGVSIQLQSLADTEAPEPEEITTTRTIPQNPLLKMAVIGGIILIFIMIVGGLINGSMNALNFSTTKIESPKISLEAIEEPVKDETGQNKTALALTSQNVEFKKIRDQKAEATAAPSPTFTPVTVAPPPTRTIPQRTQPVTVSRNPFPPRINTSVRRSLPVIQHQSQPKQVARIIPNASSAVKTQPLDPMQQWLAVANVGSFSSSVNSDDEQLNPSGIKGGIGSSTEVKNQTTAQTTDYNTKRILVGSTTEGRLETPIFWGANDDIGQNYLIKISLPLKASDGSEVLPTGSYLVAQLTNSNGSGFAQLRGVSVLINSDGNTQEKKLPENAVLIMSKNGSFLKAESRKGSNLGGDLMSAVIAGVAKAAEIQNRPRSQTNINTNGFSSTTTTNDDKNITSAFGEGAFNNVLEGIKASNQSRSGQLNSQEKVFVIDAGQTVQVFVNQTISL
ncbi:MULTISPECIES: hypothetical protein [Nostoc]|uniref:Uncharacterized protein n=2 Tax=Nostoc TaxID=1177 RepID=A0ABR8IJ00_9NOSO|nr:MULTISPECIES: hypothetical protein [Nostoc]MBD2565405.1 hypothetical protein [Nostoc linckia FACHB-391]MBD2651163.1 hypothetical protein [Nostoc foliaceum FACHB-393]